MSASPVVDNAFRELLAPGYCDEINLILNKLP
jgi:hypothetical protein